MIHGKDSMNWKFGNNINTDLITPGRYNITTDPHELANIAFIEHRPEFSKKVKRGDFVIGGENFGCGSSRETAVTALKYCGIKAILAKSFARIFYRNCLNLGLLAIATDTSDIDDGDVIQIIIGDRHNNPLLINKTKKIKTLITIPPMMIRLHKEGGIIPYLQKNGLKSLSDIGNF